MNIKQMLETIMADETRVEKTINAAGGIVVKTGDDNRIHVLIIKRSKNDHWPNVWEFPRGKCDKTQNEDLIHCLKREIKEETGLDVKPIEKIDTYEYLADGGKRKTFCHNYLCMLIDQNQEVKLSKEHDTFKWISEVGEAELMLTNEQKKTLQKVFNSDRSIVSYPEDGKSIETIEEYLNILDESEVANTMGFGAIVRTTFYGAMIAKVAYELYKRYLTKYSKQCSDLPDNEHTICLVDAKYRAKIAEISRLRSGMSKCSQAKKPEKCRSILKNKIKEAEAVAKLAKKRLAQLTRR